MASIPNNIPIAIIGGGPVGLICSILLSLQGIDNVVFERHASTAIHPKASGLHQLTTEILAKCGLLDTVYAACAPLNRASRTAWYTSLGPQGREIVSRYGFGGGPYAEAYEKASPYRFMILPQIRLEPILLARARELNPNAVFYNHEVTDLVESDTGVALTVLDRDTSATHTVRSTYALACDGGRSIATALHIPWCGEANLLDMVAAHFRAPMSRLHPDPRIFLSWFINPELGGSINTGYLYHLGPYHKGNQINRTHDVDAAIGADADAAASQSWNVDPSTEEWLFGCAILPHEKKHFSQSDMLKRMHAVLQIPGLEPEILSLSHWFVDAQAISQYHSPKHGRVFLVGDAAHKMPPWGALGLNTGVADADNVCWKLAWAIKHPEEGKWEGLLQSYTEERQPLAVRNFESSLYNMRSHTGALDGAIGISPRNSVKENVQAMEEYFDERSPEYALKRQKVMEAMDVLDLEFYAHGMEVGWFYPTPDLNHEGEGSSRHAGQVREDGSFEARVYHPSTIPGHHLPHAWLVDGEGKRMSTRHLAKKDRMVLVTENALWRHFKHESVEVVVLGEKCGLRSIDGVWEGVKGIASTGAVLVRPDGIVAWRWQDETFILEPELGQRCETLLDRILKRI